MLLSLNKDNLGKLCEEFIYDHEGSIIRTKELSASIGLTLTTDMIKDYVTEMHQTGDFDDIYCWGKTLGSNDLYKKFHPGKD